MKKDLSILSFPDLKKAGRRNPHQPILTRQAEIKPSPELLDWAQGKSFCLCTSGCQANVRDSEVLRGYLASLGLKESYDPQTANLVLFNTCAIRENAETKIYGELGQLKSEIGGQNEKIVGICGCMAQEEKPMEYIRDHFPFVNLVFGTHNIDAIYSLLDACIKTDDRVFDVTSDLGDIAEGLPSLRLDKNKAFVNIMYGCDNFCTYCIVPFTRGRQRSRSERDILKEVEDLISQGYKEVTLLGQNVNAYGFDQNGNGVSFAKLLEDVALTGIPRIRFMTSHPAYFNEEVFKVMSEHSNIMPSLHLPLQSGSDAILKRMNRHYTRKGYLDLVNLFRKYLPEAYLTTDIIVGFPGETEEDFSQTLSLCQEVKFDNAFTFIYSARAGTPAAAFPNQIGDEVNAERFARLKKTIDDQATASSLAEVGKTDEVLFDAVSKKDKNMISGYSTHNRLVHVQGGEELIGQIKKVKIKESHTYSLIGEIEDD